MILWLLACHSPEVADTDAAPVELRDWLDGASTATGGTLVVQVESDSDVKVDPPVPQVSGLTFLADGATRVEHVGPRTVATQRYAFTGDKGRYEIDLSANGMQATPIFVDIGQPPPRDGQLMDIAEPSPVWSVPWKILLGAVLLVGAVVAGAVVAFRSRPKAPALAAPSDPPDVVALRAWMAIRQDSSLDDHAKALALSRIFREYVEASLRFPATSWTTTETVEHLRGRQFLPEGNVPRAKRLLRATDRVKYAEARVGGDLFDELDADLRAFIDSTRAYRYEEVR